MLRGTCLGAPPGTVDSWLNLLSSSSLYVLGSCSPAACLGCHGFLSPCETLELAIGHRGTMSLNITRSDYCLLVKWVGDKTLAIRAQAAANQPTPASLSVQELLPEGTLVPIITLDNAGSLKLWTAITAGGTCEISTRGSLPVGTCAGPTGTIDRCFV
jgi:hypothetical protein